MYLICFKMSPVWLDLSNCGNHDASWDLTNVVLAAQGQVPVTDIPSMNRYTRELAWTQFRIGPTPGTLPDFPISDPSVRSIRQSTRTGVPRYH
jgi:hypothetical protein